jgi:hypothetical protein
MEENLNRHGDSQIHGSAAVLGKGSNPLIVRHRIPGFHENSMKTAVSLGIALRHRQVTKTHKRQ